jgi:transcriptional regulator with XRE-family HTH domain
MHWTGAGLAKLKKSKSNAVWQVALGQHLERLILSKGYDSVYDFWVQEIGEDISRSTLSYIVNAKVDAKATTLKKIADALGVKPKELLDF